MAQVSRTGYDLNRLLLDVSNMSNAEIEAAGRAYYSERFLDNARNGQRETHDGEVLYFWESRFNHSCFKVGIEKARIERLPWILPIIEGSIPDAECWRVSNAVQGRPDNRVYMVLGSFNFVVWLEARQSGGWTYSTHYPSDIRTIRGYQRRGSKIWTF